MPFVRIATQSELPAANQAKEFPCGDKLICVANVDGEISVMENTCLHQGGPLGQGVIAGGKVICPWHAWAWDPKTGEAGPPGAKVAVYPVKIEDGDVLIEVPDALAKSIAAGLKSSVLPPAVTNGGRIQAADFVGCTERG